MRHVVPFSASDVETGPVTLTSVRWLGMPATSASSSSWFVASKGMSPVVDVDTSPNLSTAVSWSLKVPPRCRPLPTVVRSSWTSAVCFTRTSRSYVPRTYG